MELGQILHEFGAHLRDAYFPTTCLVSPLYLLEDGSSAEIAVVGSEGVAGISPFMGGNITPSRAIIQSAGEAYRLKANSSRTNSSLPRSCRNCWGAKPRP